MRRFLRALLKPLVTALGFYLYDYPKGDTTATTVVLFDNGTRTLTIRRKKNPFKGKRAFPGGFLNIGDETLRQNAQRELGEETALDFPEERFEFVDVRSRPDRDPRGHVIDHGYLVIVPQQDTNAVIAAIEARDDAAGYEVVTVAELLTSAEGMAFDHVELLVAALEKAGYAPKS